MGGARAILRLRARDSGAELAAAFTQARARSGPALAALDASGKVVIADEEASLLLGVPARVPGTRPGGALAARPWTSGGWPVTPPSRLAPTTTGSVRRRS